MNILVSTLDLGNNSIQNNHLGKYIMGYMLGNLVYGDAQAEQ